MHAFVRAMLLGVTENVSSPKSISFSIAPLLLASSPQMLTGFVACLMMLVNAVNITGDNSSIASVGWVRSVAKRYCDKSLVPME